MTNAATSVDEAARPEKDRARFERDTVDAVAARPTTISCIGSDMSITGRVECAGQAQVFGRITGQLRAGGVLIGDGGAVEGDVVAQAVTIRGRFKGTVRAARVKLQGHAAVEGDVFHQSLAVEEFVLFEGASRLLGAG
jgi:cytoskeletal protein CcmA (bactofilin family)